MRWLLEAKREDRTLGELVKYLGRPARRGNLDVIPLGKIASIRPSSKQNQGKQKEGEDRGGGCDVGSMLVFEFRVGFCSQQIVKEIARRSHITSVQPKRAPL